MAEAEIGDWYVSVGSVVREDQPLVDILTDKATVEITSPVSGTVLLLHGAKGDKRPIGSELVVFEVEGATGSDPDPVPLVAEPEPLASESHDEPEPVPV